MTRSNRKKIVTAVLCVLIVFTASFIWANSLQNSEKSNAQSGAVIDIIKPLLDPADKITRSDFSFGVRKAAHFAEFMLLGGEICALCLLRRSRQFFAPPFALLLWATLDETIQKFTGRTSSVTDVLLDLCGGIFGVLLCLLICAAVKKLRRGRSRKKQKTKL